MASIWQQHSAPIPTDEFEAGSRFDVVVVGAGLTGLMSAVLLSRAKLRVAVIEVEQVGSGTTGRSTAKLSLLQGSTLQSIASRHPNPVVRAYIEANREGQAWLVRYLEEHSVPVQYRDAYTIAIGADALPTVRAEAAASGAAGLRVEEVAPEQVPLPFEVAGALRLVDQVQLDPMQVLSLLAQELHSRGGKIFAETRMLGTTQGAPLQVRTSWGELLADQLILATGTPVLDRGGHFARLSASRSHALAYRLRPDTQFTDAMVLSVDKQGYSLRTAQHETGQVLLVGGNSHPVGSGDSAAALDDLGRWARDTLPVGEQVASWSAQDYRAAGYLPLVGAVPGSSGKIHVATGFNKWGMANAVAAALRLSADILGGQVPWGDQLRTATKSAGAWRDTAGMNAKVARQLVTDWAQALTSSEEDARDAAEPTESRIGLRPVACVPEAEGRVSRVCTHLGGILHWNAAEDSWDCPLHGSRFSAEGRRLEGPALRDLPTYDSATPADAPGT